MIDTLIRNVTAVTMDGENTVLQNADIAIRDGKLVSVGPPSGEQAGTVIDGTGKVAMPGLINAHTHLPMTLLRGYADDYDLQTWLNDYIFPAEDRMDARCARVGTDLALAECLMNGTTSVSDAYFFSGEIARSVAESGMKANIARSLSWFEDTLDFQAWHKAGELRDLVEKWHGYDHGRILAETSIHAEYTSTPALWDALADYAREKGLGMNVHLSETEREQTACLQKYGKTPTRLFLEHGVWDGRALAAHCIWLTPEDVDILREKNVTAVHNPVSNGKLASGVCDVRRLLDAGLNVALGTDGVSSNNSHDMFEEIKAALLLQRLKHRDAQALSRTEALRLATLGGAVAQGRETECGALVPGMDADLILLDFTRPNLVPCTDVLSNLAFSACGRDVCLTMVRGRVLYRDGEFLTIDMERVRWEMEHTVKERMGLNG